MQGDQQSSVLWEDLSEVCARLEKTSETLRALERAVQDGRIGQPTRQDSKRLNRLVVLAELLYTETRPWSDEKTEAAPAGKNGRHA